MGTKTKDVPLNENGMRALRRAQSSASRLRGHVAKLAAENAELRQLRKFNASFYQKIKELNAEAGDAREAGRREQVRAAAAIERLHETASVGMAAKNVGTAKLIEVLEVSSHEGAGETLNPYRIVRTFWSKDGTLLATDDPWARDHLQKVAEATEPVTGSAQPTTLGFDEKKGWAEVPPGLDPNWGDEFEKRGFTVSDEAKAREKAAKVMLPRKKR